jgi:hypothetical protein
MPGSLIETAAAALRMIACYCLVLAEQRLDSAGFSPTINSFAFSFIQPGPEMTTSCYCLVLQPDDVVQGMCLKRIGRLGYLKIRWYAGFFYRT